MFRFAFWFKFLGLGSGVSIEGNSFCHCCNFKFGIRVKAWDSFLYKRAF